MLITHEQMSKINQVQIGILSAVSDACAKLNIPFYMVHGSLLGTIRDHKFVQGDDDIDIAMFRDDYDRFVKEAPACMEKCFFIQTHQSDANYPLSFGKVRDSRTTYVVENAKHLNMNHGIYIDVFPIDYCADHPLRRKWEALLIKGLNYRIASVYRLSEQKMWKKAVRSALKILMPSHTAAIRFRERVLATHRSGDYIRVTGGKTSEQFIPAQWFAHGAEDEFEGIPVFVPGGYRSYLTKIYGDYQNRTLIEEKVSDDKVIEVNACVVDTESPYTQYITEQR